MRSVHRLNGAVNQLVPIAPSPVRAHLKPIFELIESYDQTAGAPGGRKRWLAELREARDEFGPELKLVAQPFGPLSRGTNVGGQANEQHRRPARPCVARRRQRRPRERLHRISPKSETASARASVPHRRRAGHSAHGGVSPASGRCRKILAAWEKSPRIRTEADRIVAFEIRPSAPMCYACPAAALLADPDCRLGITEIREAAGLTQPDAPLTQRSARGSVAAHDQPQAQATAAAQPSMASSPN